MQPTREEILNEPLGIRLYEWIEEYIFEYELKDPDDVPANWVGSKLVWEGWGGNGWRGLRDFSKMTHAWEVVEKLRKEGNRNLYVEIRIYQPEFKSPCFEVWFFHWRNEKDYICLANTEGETLSLAICRAALLAKLDKE